MTNSLKNQKKAIAGKAAKTLNGNTHVSLLHIVILVGCMINVEYYGRDAIEYWSWFLHLTQINFGWISKRLVEICIAIMPLIKFCYNL